MSNEQIVIQHLQAYSTCLCQFANVEWTNCSLDMDFVSHLLSRWTKFRSMCFQHVLMRCGMNTVFVSVKTESKKLINLVIWLQDSCDELVIGKLSDRKLIFLIRGCWAWRCWSRALKELMQKLEETCTEMQQGAENHICEGGSKLMLQLLQYYVEITPAAGVASSGWW